jgi:hypothetical protein
MRVRVVKVATEPGDRSAKDHKGDGMDKEIAAADGTMGITKILGALPKIASGVVGITAIAYVLGWRIADAYFGQMGASWCVDLMTIQQITRYGALMVFFASFVCASCTKNLISGQTTQQKLNRWAAFWALSGLLISGLAGLHPHFISASIVMTAAEVAPLLIMASVGISVGELIAFFSTGKPAVSYFPLMYEAIILLGLFWTPVLLGTSHAEKDSGSSSTLPNITLTIADSRPWRLVGPIGDQLLIIVPNDDSKQRLFKLVSPSAVASIATSDTRGGAH